MKIPMPQVLAWLQENHPDLWASAKTERSWVWLVAPLQQAPKEVRESIKQYGFKFCKRGHALPGGQISHWAHHCDRPMPFRGRAKVQSSNKLLSQKLPSFCNNDKQNGLTAEEMEALLCAA